MKRKQINKIRNIQWKRLAWKAVVGFLAVSILSVIAMRFIPVPFTPLTVIRSIEQLSSPERDFTLKKDWVPLSDISPQMIRAVISSEDNKFMEHNGFDFDAIERAIRHNKNSKKKVGASTISQQTAKNVFLYNRRDWVRKGLETYFTVLIETFWPKDRIMEVYLNVIEFGDGIYGIEAAAQNYYHKKASKLNADEAAMLAAILPNPLKFSPLAPSSFLKKRKSRILREMRYVHQQGTEVELLTAK